MPSQVGTAVMMVLALLATAEAAFVALSAQWIGFPDGFKTGLDRLHQVTYPVTAAIFGLFALAAVVVAVQFSREKLRGKRPVLWMLGIWLFLNVAAFGVDQLCAYLRPPQAEMG